MLHCGCYGNAKYSGGGKINHWCKPKIRPALKSHWCPRVRWVILDDHCNRGTWECFLSCIFLHRPTLCLSSRTSVSARPCVPCARPYYCVDNALTCVVCEFWQGCVFSNQTWKVTHLEKMTSATFDRECRRSCSFFFFSPLKWMCFSSLVCTDILNNVCVDDMLKSRLVVLHVL